MLPTSCAACRSPQVPIKDWLCRCGHCGLLSSNLEPAAGTVLDGLEALRRANAEATLDGLAELRPLPGLRLLDVGCAMGWFLAAARARGVIVHGIEPDPANAAEARAAGFDVVTGYFPGDLDTSTPYDIIIFNDVFEHLPEPHRAIVDVASRLAPGGLAVINLPSSRGILYRIAKAFDGVGWPGLLERLWQKGFASPHMSYFAPGNLRMLVERHTGLREHASFNLPTYQRAGLGDRIAMTHRGPTAWLLLAGLWCFSFLLPLLPADIHVGVFRKPE